MRYVLMGWSNIDGQGITNRNRAILLSDSGYLVRGQVTGDARKGGDMTRNLAMAIAQTVTLGVIALATFTYAIQIGLSVLESFLDWFF
jgi:hypothetical protein